MVEKKTHLSFKGEKSLMALKLFSSSLLKVLWILLIIRWSQQRGAGRAEAWETDLYLVSAEKTSGAWVSRVETNAFCACACLCHHRDSDVLPSGGFGWLGESWVILWCCWFWTTWQRNSFLWCGSVYTKTMYVDPPTTPTAHLSGHKYSLQLKGAKLLHPLCTRFMWEQNRHVNEDINKGCGSIINDSLAPLVGKWFLWQRLSSLFKICCSALRQTC